MGYYINIENGVLNGTSEVNNSRFYTETYFQAEVSKEIYEDYSENPDKYLYDAEAGVIVENPDYESILAERERERVAMLNLTAADVERAIYKVKGLDFDDIITFVEQSGAQINLKALKIELRANNFYRGNPYIEQVGTLLGFTTEQLDRFFETNDYKELTK